MTAKLPGKGRKSTAPHNAPAATEAATHEMAAGFTAASEPALPPRADDQWSMTNQSRYARSYDALSNALMAIFERYYLPLSVMTPDPESESHTLTAEGLARFQQIKDRFMFYMRDDESAGTLQLQITPSPHYRGILKTGLCDDYLNGPEEIKQTIVHFFEDLTESAAGIQGVAIDMRTHTIRSEGPQPFYDMVAALTNDLAIVTAERHAELYVEMRTQQNDDDEQEAAEEVQIDDDHVTAILLQHQMNSVDSTPYNKSAIPEMLFQMLPARPYGFRELGHLVNKFNSQNTMPLFSLQALQAVVDQDLAKNDGAAISVRYPGFNLH